MPDILIRDIDPETKLQIQSRAKVHNRSISDETKALIQRGLLQTELKAKPDKMGLGTALRSMIPADLWDEDFIVERDKSDRPPPDFT